MDNNVAGFYVVDQVHGMEESVVSEKFQAMLDKMTPEDRKAFVEMMKDDNTFFADSIEDVVAILGNIQEEKKKH